LHLISVFLKLPGPFARSHDIVIFQGHVQMPKPNLGHAAFLLAFVLHIAAESDAYVAAGGRQASSSGVPRRVSGGEESSAEQRHS